MWMAPGMEPMVESSCEELGAAGLEEKPGVGLAEICTGRLRIGIADGIDLRRDDFKIVDFHFLSCSFPGRYANAGRFR